MSSLKFCANLSWMFTELQGFPQRMYAAAAAGFQAVEAAWLYDADINELKEAKRRTGLRVVLINTPPGDIKAGELGLGAVPGRQAEFRRGLESAVTLAKALDCSRAPWILLRGVAVHHFMATPYREMRKMAVRALRAEKEGHKSMYITEEHSAEAKIEDAATVNRSNDGKTVKTGILALLESPQKGQKIHLMAGRVPLGMDRACIAMEMEATFIDNLKFAADVLSEEGILGLIEPINTRITDPQYFLETPPQAASILQKVGRSNIKLQMDIFHWQIMDGNLTQNIQKYFPIIGHVQIAQVPDRNEPDSSGEVNFPYLFDLLETVGYKGYIGCEYKPNSTTEAGLGWLREYWTNHKTKDAGVPSCPSDP